MKILGLRVRPIARIGAFIYAFFGFAFWLSFALSNAEYITLPVGVIAPLLHLNVNFNLHRSSSILANFLFLLGSLGTYALTGWFTAAVAVLCFNGVAKRVGGINANFILLWEPQQAQVGAAHESD